MSQFQIDALAIAIQAGENAGLVGPPGTGKSRVAESIGTALNYWMPNHLFPSGLEGPDVHGFPQKVQREVRRRVEVWNDAATEGELPGWVFDEIIEVVDYIARVPPKWAVDMLEEQYKGNMTLLFIDELSTAQPDVQAAFLSVVLDKVVGDIKLNPALTRVVFAMNPPETSAGGQSITAPLVNRCIFIDWHRSLAEWTEGMLTDWPTPSVPKLPRDWKQFVPNATAEIIGYLKRNSNNFNQLAVDQLEKKATRGALIDTSRPYATDRSWTMLANVLGAAKSVNAALEVEWQLIVGTVGDAAGKGFSEYRANLNLPDPEVLLRDPKKFDPEKIGSRADIFHVILSNVVNAVKANPSQARFDACWEIMRIALVSKKASDTVALNARLLMPLRQEKAYKIDARIAAEFTPILMAAQRQGNN